MPNEDAAIDKLLSDITRYARLKVMLSQSRRGG